MPEAVVTSKQKVASTCSVGCHIAVLVRDIFRNLAILVSRDGLAVAVDGDRLIDCGGGGGNGVHLTGIGDVAGQLDGIAVLGLAQSRRPVLSSWQPPW